MERIAYTDRLIWKKMTRNVGHFGGSASMESMALTDEGLREYQKELRGFIAALGLPLPFLGAARSAR